MSFRCAKCKAVAGKGQMVVTETRSRNYQNMRHNEFGIVEETVTSVGSEIVREERQCFKCIGVPAPV